MSKLAKVIDISSKQLSNESYEATVERIKSADIMAVYIRGLLRETFSEEARDGEGK